ncbi:MAG: hypothetical protein AAGL24_01870 [Pseudomonadota bacterium]
MSVKHLDRIMSAAAIGTAALLLTACNEGELGRPLTFDKGVYGGPQDEVLTEEQRRELRRRTDLQRF